MKAAEGKFGRIFVIRLEQGDEVPGCIEDFAEKNEISVGLVTLIGGIGDGEVVVGPRRSDEMPPKKMSLPVDGTHETIATGVLAPDINGRTTLHIHASLGRAGRTLTGCLRPGVTTWLVGEVILCEILDTGVKRLLDKESGFSLLEPEKG